jgi:hypothetical protein
MSLRSRWARLSAVVVLAGVVVTGIPAIRTSLLRAAGRVLVVDEPIEPADVIVLPKWAGAAGAIDASDLVHKRIANLVAVLPELSEPSEQELARRGVRHTDQNLDLVQVLHALGVAKVELIPEAAAGTEAEGQVLLAWCSQRHFSSIIVMTSPDHSRRVRRVLHRALQAQAIKVTIRSARYSGFAPESWWTTRDGARTEIVELQKLFLDVLRHPIP